MVFKNIIDHICDNNIWKTCDEKYLQNAINNPYLQSCNEQFLQNVINDPYLESKQWITSKTCNKQKHRWTWVWSLNVMSKNKSNHHYKIWVQFTSPHSLDRWIHCLFIGPCSLQPMNSLKIQWNHLTYRDTVCCSEWWQTWLGNISEHSFVGSLEAQMKL